MSEVPGIRREAVCQFFGAQVPGGKGPLEFELISGGRSNLTYRVSGPDRDWVLRRPPLGHVLPTAHDMSREYRVLSALAETPVPTPRTFALCEDPAVNGAPFYVMEYTPGVILADAYPESYVRDPGDGRRISQQLIDTLVILHEVDFRAVGLETFGRPDGYLERQLDRWARQWEGNRTGPLPEIPELGRRLRAALPRQSGSTIVHGDYRLGNMALDPDCPGKVLAVFDWEMATLGDPLADLGYTLIYWVEAGDASDDGALSGPGGVTARPGFYSRDELIGAYTKASGRDVGSIDFYQVLALYKLAVISEGIYKRFQLGKTVGKGFAGMSRSTQGLAQRAIGIAERSADAHLRG